MSVWITIRRKGLERLDACEDGLFLYEQIVAHQKRKDRIRFKWTPLADVYLSLTGHAGWLRERRFIPSASLYGANLDGASLYGANLDGANLEGANLEGARRPFNAPNGWRSVNGYLQREET